MHARAEELCGFALDVLAIGGNGEGWTINDAIAALRVALEDTGVDGAWLAPVEQSDMARLRAFVGGDL